MAQAVGAGTRLPRRERAHAAGPLPTGTRSMARRGQLRGAGRRVSCIPVAQSFALPRRSRSWFRCPASGRFGPSAQQPTGLTLPFAPLDTRNARAQRGRGRPAPMARAVGAGTRLPQRERAHAAGLLPTGTRSMARRGQPQGAGRRVSCAFQALATLAPPAFAAKTAHAIASVGRVWDPPASERRPSPYRAQRGRPLTAAVRAKQLFSAKTVDKAKRWCYHSCKQRRRRQSRYESSTHGPQLRLLLYL